MASGPLRAWRARWVVTGVGDPIAQGVVVSQGERILSVERSYTGRCLDLGDVVLLPGLINAHTHLEFSDLPSPLGRPGQSFPQWIANVIAWRRGRKVESEAVVHRGLCELRRCGVAALGEIATGDTWTATLKPSLATIAFHESICLQRDRIAATLARAEDFLTTNIPGAAWQAGISPHAPYTVHPQLLVELAALATRRRVPLAMHLAESREELELLADGTGSFLDLFAMLGIAWPHRDWADFRRPADYLNALQAAPRVLIVHGNYLTADEHAWLAHRRKNMSLVYCPRTHAYFGHERYPLDALLEQGVALAVGTDGRGSNPDLNLLAELRFVAQQYPQLDPQQILHLGTLGAARALGIDDRWGSIEMGKHARFCVVPIDADGTSDPLAAVLHGQGEPRSLGFDD